MKPSRYSPAAVLACLLLAGCGDGKIDRIEWTVMGTVAAVQTKGDRNGGTEADVAVFADAVRKVFHEVEDRMNAHRPGSELCRLAQLADGEVLAQCDGNAAPGGIGTRPCYEAAFRLAEATGGAFNPRWRGPGTLDLGAIAKGFAVDAAAMAAPCPGRDALIDLGGNLKSYHGMWRTGVRSPDGDGFAAVVELGEGESLSTSATYYRGGHIHDGRTGCVVSNGVASVTVLCRSAMWADALSTALFVLGPEEGRAFLGSKAAELTGEREVSALWIMDDGSRVVCGDDRF